ncbi:hypothetical protein IJ182_01140 [bacterium]|nr:hypothetical protein [bacterium]
MKKFFSSILILLSFTLSINIVNAEDDVSIQKLRAGTFIRVMTLDEFSTLTADIDDEVKFINVQDMYVYETNAVPEGTIFYGEIEDVREPVQGKDGALKILINKMITPDKKVYKLKAYIYGEDDNYIGGRNTEPMYYHKTPHYTQGFRPMLHVVPLNIHEMGKHTVVKPGAELFVILENDVILK